MTETHDKDKEANGGMSAHYTDKLIELEHEIMIFSYLEDELISTVHSQLSYLNSSIVDMKTEMERRQLIEEVEEFKQDASYIMEYREEMKAEGVSKKKQLTDEQLLDKITIKMTKPMLKKVARADELIDKLIPKDHVKIWLNSGGGNVTDTFALIDQIHSMKCPVHIVGTGRVMSAATLLIMNGAKGHRGATKNTIFMTHGGDAGVGGSTEDMRAGVELNEEIDKMCKEMTLKLTKIKSKPYDEMHTGANYYFRAPEALKLGIIDYIVGEK